MTFQYYPNERYLTDNEYKELIKHNRLKILGSITIRIIASLPFLFSLYLLSYVCGEANKLIIILLLAVLGLILPAALAIILQYFIFKILKIFILLLESIFCFLIDIIKHNLKEKEKEKEKEKVKVELESFLTRMKENAIEILICLSFVTIAGFLLWLINMTLTDPDYKTFSITMVSIIYSSGIAKYANSILEIAGFDLELLKKDKENYSSNRFLQNINSEPKLPLDERKKMITQDFSKPLETATVLQKIVLDKAEWVKNKESEFPLSEFEKNIQKSDRAFYDALAKGTHQKPAYILECKKASPSKGLIRSEFKPTEIAQVYKHYANAISVLTDEKYFQGDFSYIKQVRDVVTQPVLCKDFMISEYQVYLARYHQADAILLMLSVVNDETYRILADLAHSLGMGVLTETSNEEEFERALALGAKIIGVNNRNLHDLSVDLNRVVALTSKYADRIPADVRIISESGIYHHQQVRELQHVAHGFLIGSSLMGNPDLNNAVREVIFGENKVCGLTRAQDVKTVYESGALYGGLIFVENSKRCVSLRQAQELVTAAPLRFVGVFQNQDIDFIVKIAQQLQLYAVQLHGDETAEFITALRAELPKSIRIWKAISVDVTHKSAVVFDDVSEIDRFVFDSKSGAQQGGTGETFDWSLIPAQLKHKILLAGGINPNNIDIALAQHCVGVDLNSGVESAPGVKDAEKVRSVFKAIL